MGPRTAHSAQGEATPTLNTTAQSPPWPAGWAGSDAPQAAEVLPPWLPGQLLCHTEPAASQHPQVPFCRAALQPLLSQFILVPGVTPFQLQNLAFVLVKFHAIEDWLPSAPIYLEPSARPVVS